MLLSMEPGRPLAIFRRARQSPARLVHMPRVDFLTKFACPSQKVVLKPPLWRLATWPRVGFLLSGLLNRKAGPKPALYHASACSRRQISKTLVRPSQIAMVPGVSSISARRRLGLPQLLMNGPFAFTHSFFLVSA